LDLDHEENRHEGDGMEVVERKRTGEVTEKEKGIDDEGE